MYFIVSMQVICLFVSIREERREQNRYLLAEPLFISIFLQVYHVQTTKSNFLIHMTNGNSEILSLDEIFYIMRVSIVRGTKFKKNTQEKCCRKERQCAYGQGDVIRYTISTRYKWQGFFLKKAASISFFPWLITDTYDEP